MNTDVIKLSDYTKERNDNMTTYKAPRVGEYKTSSEYVGAMEEFYSQDDVKRRADSDDLHKKNVGYVDTCEGIDKTARETVSGARSFIEGLFPARQEQDT